MTAVGSFDGGSQSLIRPVSSITEREKAVERRIRRAAVRTVASNAQHADDLRALLDALGLHPSEGKHQP